MLILSTTLNDFENRFIDKLVFNANGRLVGESPISGEQSGVYRSCSTMLNGEALIFGGNYDDPYSINRQVDLINLILHHF